jgi:hypothetical protein
MRRALEPPYSSPYKVPSQREKTLQLLVQGKPVTMSKDRVKPAYILNKTDHRNNFNQPTATTPAIAPPATPQPHALVATFIFPLASTSERLSPRGGDVGTSHNRNNPLPSKGSLTYVSETTHSWKAVMEPLEAVISTRSSGSYKGSSFVNSERKPAERCACCKHSIVGTILLAFKSRLVCIFCTSTINIYT